jgi:RNA polymerase sigma-70 factor (ECF subfamily)
VDEHKIIENIANGDRSNFKELVDKYQSLVLNTCHHFVHNKQSAEDLAQEVFLEVYLSAHKFKKEAKLSTWLYRIAVNKSLNYLRDNKKWDFIKSIETLFKSGYNEPVAENSTHENSDELQKKLNQIIDSLPKKQKTVFTLCKMENLTYKEAAEVLEVPVTTIEGLMHRAKRSVKEKIEKYYKKK